MRAVKSIILACGSLKRKYQNDEESLLVLRAINDCNIPKFTTADVPLFNAIMSDLFPSKKENPRDYGDLEEYIQKFA